MKYCPSCLKCYEEGFDLCADDSSTLAELPSIGKVVAGKYRLGRLITEALDEKPLTRLQSIAEFARKLRSNESPAGQPPPRTPELTPPVSDSETHSQSTNPLPAPASEASAPPPSGAKPVRNLGLIDDCADDDSTNYIYRLSNGPPRVKKESRSVVEPGVVAAPDGPQRPSRNQSRAHSERTGKFTLPPVLSSGSLRALVRHSLVVVPTLLVLALGAFGWLVLRPAPPPSIDRDAASATNSAPPLKEAKPPRSGMVQGAAGLSTEAEGKRGSHRDKLPGQGGEARGRASSRAPSDESIDGQKVPSDEGFANSAAGPQAKNVAAIAAGLLRPRRIAGGRCTIMTSKSTVLVKRNGRPGLITLVYVGVTADAVKATTGDWSDIAVFGTPLDDGSNGISVYRVVSVSGRVGSYRLRFNSPCGSRHVLVKVE